MPRDLYTSIQCQAISPSSKSICFRSCLYRPAGIKLPVGTTSISLRMIPDFESVIWTGSFVPMKSIHLARILNAGWCFSLTRISSCDISEFSFVLSSILSSLPSYCIATNGLFLNAAVENWLFCWTSSLALNTE